MSPKTSEAPDPIDVAVGARIRLRRRSLGMSQTTLAEALNISFQQIQKYERGSNRVSASKLVHAASVLHCSVAHLVGEGEGADSFMPNLLPNDALELIEAFAKVSEPRDRRAIIDLARALGNRS